MTIGVKVGRESVADVLFALALGRSPQIGEKIRIMKLRDDTEFGPIIDHGLYIYSEEYMREWIQKPPVGLMANIIKIDWSRPDALYVRTPVGDEVWVWPDDVEFYDK